MARRIIISGGGTGGHVFPAISIANALSESQPAPEILFVGAEGRMEMEKVPDAGYEIKGLPVAGIERKLTLRNLRVIYKLFKSLRSAERIIKDFKPDVIVGVGGYASGPVLRKAAKLGIPSLIQEQNSYAGLTNKLLSKRTSVICVAYEGMDKYFPKEKIIFTGNPVRKDIVNQPGSIDTALAHFGLDSEKPVLLVLGGSLGSRTINHSIGKGIIKLEKRGFQIIWQTGESYYEEMKRINWRSGSEHTYLNAFINRMDLAYLAADVIVSRAGAGTISELCIAGKPVILVPSPNVAEDHQTKNAQALVDKDAAILVKDSDAANKLTGSVIDLIREKKIMNSLSENISRMAIRDADKRIAEEVIKLVE